MNYTKLPSGSEVSLELFVSKDRECDNILVLCRLPICIKGKHFSVVVNVLDTELKYSENCSSSLLEVSDWETVPLIVNIDGLLDIRNKSYGLG